MQAATNLACISGVIWTGAGAKSMQKMPNPHSRTVANFLGCVLITLVVAATTVSFPRLVLGDVLWSCWLLAFSVGLLSDPMVTQLCLPSSRSAFLSFRSSVSSW